MSRRGGWALISEDVPPRPSDCGVCRYPLAPSALGRRSISGHETGLCSVGAWPERLASKAGSGKACGVILFAICSHGSPFPQASRYG
jgi:hypothetical protein